MAVAALLDGIIKAVGIYLRIQLKLIRAVQELAGIYAMGCFISHAAGDAAALRNQLDGWKAVLNAYVAWISTPCIFSCFWQEIQQSPALKRYFSGFPDYAAWQQYYAQPPESRRVRTWQEFVSQTLARMFSLERGIDLSALFRAEYSNANEIMSGLVLQPEKTEAMSPQELINYINQNVKNSQIEPSQAYAPFGYWLATHPFLSLDWIVITANASAMYAYETAQAQAYAAEAPAAYVDRQRVHVELDGSPAYVKYLTSQGTLSVCIPQPPPGTEIAINTYGLRQVIAQNLRPSFKYVNISKNWEVPLSDEKQVKAYIDAEGYTVLEVEDLPPAYWGGREPDYDDLRLRYKFGARCVHVQIYEGEIADACEIWFNDEKIWQRSHKKHELPYELMYDRVLYF